MAIRGRAASRWGVGPLGHWGPLRALRRRVLAWVDARRPAAQEQRLNRHCLYIFPSLSGFVYLVLIAILWVVGTNYENNLVLALAFLLVALFVVSILHTFANLAGVTIRWLGASAAVSGERAQLRLVVSRNDRRPREAIRLAWGDGESQVSLMDSDEQAISLFVTVTGRGWCDPGPLRVETHYPLGILRCWTRLNMAARVLVYPRPVPAGPLPRGQAISEEEGSVSTAGGGDEFAGYKDYQPGDSLRDVDWKHYARGMGLYSKDYSAYLDSRLWLDWDYLGGMDREARLSRLCYWVLEASGQECDYGLRLPGDSLSPARGPEHRDRALRKLALFEAPGGSP